MLKFLKFKKTSRTARTRARRFHSRRPTMDGVGLETRTLLSVTFTGDVVKDFLQSSLQNVVCLDADPTKEVTIDPSLKPLIRISGLEISSIVVSYDTNVDTMNLGFLQPLDTVTKKRVIAGDVDNNGDSGTVNWGVLALQPFFQDFPGLGGPETMYAMLDLNHDGTTDVVAGIPNNPDVSKDYQVALADVSNPFLSSFGQTLPDNTGMFSLLNDPDHGAFEFSITHFSELYQSVVNQPLTAKSVIDIGAFAASTADFSGDIFLPLQTVPFGRLLGSMNHAPTIETVNPQQATVGKPLTLPIRATDVDAGQTLTYALDAGAPAGANIDPVTGLLTFTPRAAGTTMLSVRVTDNDTPGLSTTTVVKVTVLPAPIQIGNVKLISANNLMAGIAVTLDTQLNPTTARDKGNYSLVQLVTTGKGSNAVTTEKVIALRSAVYKASTGRVLLTPATRFALTGVYQLKIDGSKILDQWGRGLDGNRDGRPGGLAKYALTKTGGKVVPSARSM